MEIIVPKAKLKPQILRHFRDVERTGRGIIVTDHGRPVLKIVPYTADPLEALSRLRGTVLKFSRPTDPIGEDEWNALR
jgi:antitoxin (DNA-binding transcriptional repressor) of toxin-antitoxin stability system